MESHILMRLYSKYWIIVFSQPVPKLVILLKHLGFYRYQSYASIKQLMQLRHEVTHRKQILSINPYALIFVLSDRQLIAYPELRIFIEKWQIGEPVLWI